MAARRKLVTFPIWVGQAASPWAQQSRTLCGASLPCKPTSRALQPNTAPAPKPPLEEVVKQLPARQKKMFNKPST